MNPWFCESPVLPDPKGLTVMFMEVVGDDLWLRIMEEVAVMRRVHRGHKSHKSKGHGFRLVILISDPTMST